MSRASFPKPIYHGLLRDVVMRALAEDIGPRDVTATSIQDYYTRARARVVAKSEGVLAGADAVSLAFRTLDTRAAIRWSLNEGELFGPGITVATIDGDLGAILAGERTALNFLGHLSGIATVTQKFVKAVEDSDVRILDTRKTTPGLRLLEKRAVRLGGGTNHRLGLYDAAMFKDNHLDRSPGFAKNLTHIPKRIFQRQLKMSTEPGVIAVRPAVCEVRNLREAKAALAAGFRWLLLDNFKPARLRRVVTALRTEAALYQARVLLECSGNVVLRNVASYAATGVDFISIGSLTHSAPASDFSLVWDR